MSNRDGVFQLNTRMSPDLLFNKYTNTFHVTLYTFHVTLYMSSKFSLFTETKKPQKYMKHCLFEATICLCGVNNKIQKRVSDYKFIYANLRIRQNNLVVCNEFNFKLLKFFT